ncbi:MAG: hypothetical protein OSA99_03635 [Acidimicrobiales bacterium]|nr:hypothetical protein [Acidimicrobiales bacterium]
MAETSPFPFQGPLRAGEVTGRDDLRRDLAERLTGRQVTALLGPRRYGKTSLLRRITADLADVGPETVWIDLYELNSMADLAGAIDHAIAGLAGRVRKMLDAITSDLSFRIGSLGVELSRSARERPDPVLAVRALLRKLVEVGMHHDLIVVFDEFSGIANVDRAAGLLRTELQHHYRDLGIVFAGSEPSTMRMLFSDQAQPFFAQADLIEIGPLTDVEIADIVDAGFARTDRSPGSARAQIIKFVRGHPQRMMQMADAVWRHTDEGSTADLETWEQALSAVRSSVDSGTERLYALLPTGQQKTLRAIVSGGSPYGTAADVLELPAGTATGAIESLTNSGYLIRTNDKLLVVDPLFADWIRRRFPV